MATINGTANNDELLGFATDDTINGFEGDDSLTGGWGNDTLIGGAGADVVYLEGNPGDFRFALNPSGQVVATDLNDADGNEGVDILADVETIQFTDRHLDGWQGG